jgi:hypothetical protein
MGTNTSTKDADYILDGELVMSNNNVVNDRDTISNHIIIEPDASGSKSLIIEGITTAYSKKSVLNIINTQFNYFSFPVQVTYTVDNIDTNIDIPALPAEEADDIIFARYKPDPEQNIQWAIENWAAVPLSTVEAGATQKNSNWYYITADIKKQNAPIRFRGQITIELNKSSNIEAEIGLIRRTPKPLPAGQTWEWWNGWNTGVQWPDTSQGGNPKLVPISNGTNTVTFDYTIYPAGADNNHSNYDIGDEFAVSILVKSMIPTWDSQWHWWGQYGSDFNTAYHGFFQEASTRTVGSSQWNHAKQIAPPDWWVKVLNTYVEMDKYALRQKMRASRDIRRSSDWNFGGENNNVYNEFVRKGFTWSNPDEIVGFQTVISADGVEVPVPIYKAYTYQGLNEAEADYKAAEEANAAQSPEGDVYINSTKTWLSVTDGRKSVDTWNRPGTWSSTKPTVSPRPTDSK